MTTTPAQHDWLAVPFWGGPADGQESRWRPLRPGAQPQPIVRLLDPDDACRPTLPHPVTVHVYCLEDLAPGRWRYRYSGTEVLT